jgi:hypothetical protein
MFLGNLFKLLFFFLIIYFVYSLFRLVFHSARKSWEQTERLRKEYEQKKTMRGKGSRQEKGEGVIELDKDQYKVE